MTQFKLGPPKPTTANATPDQQQMKLETFLTEHYAQTLVGQPYMMTRCRSAINWLARDLDRQPRLSDLSDEKLIALQRFLFRAGIGPSRVKVIRGELSRLWRFAADEGRASGHVVPTVVQRPKHLAAKPTSDDWEAPPGSLLLFFRDKFRPTIEGRSQNTISRNALAVRRFCEFMGRSPLVEELDETIVLRFLGWLQGCCLPEPARMVANLRRILAAANPNLQIRQKTRHRAQIHPPATGLPLFDKNVIEANGIKLTAQTTLSQFFDDWFVPHWLCRPGDARSPKTAKSYRESLKYWKQATGDPPLDEIDDVMTDAFVAGLRTLPGARRGSQLSQATVRKHCVQLQTVLDRNGPYDRKKRNQELLDRVPWIKPPSLGRNQPRDPFSLDELGDLLKAADVMRLPLIDGVEPRDWWRALYLVAYNLGARIETLMGLQWSMIGTHFTVPTSIMKGGRSQRFYLNHTARRWLNRIKTPRRYVFEFYQWPASESWLHENRRRLERLANVRPLGFHGVRRAHATQISLSGMRLAQESLGHSSQQTTRDHYVTLDAALDLLPQPAGA